MSGYVSGVAGVRGRVGSVVSSVGENIDSSQVYSRSHPLYKHYSRCLEEKIAEIIARNTEKEAKAQQAVCSVALDIEDKNEVTREYPEFRIVWPMMRTPVHSVWAARRELVNQFMRYHSRTYAVSAVHYGGSALAALTHEDSAVELCVNTASAIGVHESFEDDVLASRLCASAATVSSSLGWVTDSKMVSDYWAGSTLRKQPVGGVKKQTDALIIDGTLHFVSPLQFAAAMIEHGAEIGMFCMPYHPSMLIHQAGELCGTGVHYSVGSASVRLQYPEGVAGQTWFCASAWHDWLINTQRVVAGTKGVSFQYELMGVRGPFMVVRVVRSMATVPDGTVFVHSLQLEGNEALSLVKTWKLRNLAVDPYNKSAWEPVEITVPTRVLEKTVDYGMSLAADQFSLHAIRKRLVVVNDRVVVQGTSVKVNDALTSESLNHLETAVFAHCFVARYESGRLAGALRGVVDKVAGFGSLSSVMRVAHVMAACLSMAYDWTIGAVDERLRNVFDNVRRWFGGIRESRHVSFEPAPQFIRYETMIGSRFGQYFDRVKMLMGSVCIDALAPTMPGFKVLAARTQFEEAAVMSVPLDDLSGFTVRGRSHVFEDVNETMVPTDSAGADVDPLISRMRSLNAFQEAPDGRHLLVGLSTEAGIGKEEAQHVDFQYDPGFKQTLDDFHEAVNPGMRAVDFKYDPSSISVDDQDRSLAAEHLVLPLDFGEVPRPMKVFSSKLHAYNVTRRPITLHEMLSAFNARNLSAPVLALPQDDEALLKDVWENFLDVACVPDARARVIAFQNDPVSLEELAMRDWAGKARPENVSKVFKYLCENPEAWEEMRVGRYDSMPKTDVKPPLSDKPLHSRVEPQVIVHHISAVNAIFSSIFRVLVRRFLSLLKPNFMLNLLKDMPQVRDMMQACHDWDSKITYLENDFSKYDKSQGQFAHALKQYVYMLLGLNKTMLQAWGLGHVDCSIRSVTTGLSLSVRYQQKSGDASTAFGNGLVNIVSVCYAYKGTDIVWGVFMGDDSLMAVRSVCAGDVAVAKLAEIFNLQAKFYVTDAPYFASNFVLLDAGNRRITCVPDPLKRVERWSMAVSAVDPKWPERFISAVSTLEMFRKRGNLTGLGRAMMVRYGSNDVLNFDAVGDAIASAIRSFEDFRSMWEDEPETLVF